MNVLTQLVQGLGVDMFHEMHEWLNPLASLSRRVAESDTDNVVKCGDSSSNGFGPLFWMVYHVFMSPFPSPKPPRLDITRIASLASFRRRPGSTRGPSFLRFRRPNGRNEAPCWK
jgi:hypothetical protein